MSKNVGEEFYFKIFTNSTSLEINLLLDTLRERDATKTTIQVLDPTYIISRIHLQSAIYHTEKSFENKRNIARNKANEFLIRLSGKRQITNALKFFGLKDSSQYLLLLAFGDILENNKNELEKIVSRFNLNNNVVETALPLTSLKDLSEYYMCMEDFDEIEKKGLERIASVEIL